MCLQTEHVSALILQRKFEAACAHFRSCLMLASQGIQVT